MSLKQQSGLNNDRMAYALPTRNLRNRKSAANIAPNKDEQRPKPPELPAHPKP